MFASGSSNNAGTGGAPRPDAEDVFGNVFEEVSIHLFFL
jgi:hypothetical protein